MSILPAAAERDPDWPEPLPRVLSPSSVSTFLTCPEQWRRVYCLGEYSRVSGALVIGGAESAAAEANFLHKRAEGADMALADVEYRAAEAFETDLGQREVDWEPKDGEGSPGEALDTTIRLVRVGHSDEYPLVRQPVIVEGEANFQVDGSPLVRAYVDVTEPGRIVSRKTSSKKSMAGSKAAPSRSWFLQSAIESAALGLPSVWHVLVKGDLRLVAGDTDPAFCAPDVGRATELATRLVSTATRSMRALLAELGPYETWPTTAAMHFAAKGAGGMTSCGFCAFRETCPAWQ